MENLNELDYEQLKILIEKLIDKRVYEILNNLGVESTSMGKIVALDKTNRVAVELSNGEIISNLYNASREPLKIGDFVKIFGSRTNMSNRYVGIKYEREV